MASTAAAAAGSRAWTVLRTSSGHLPVYAKKRCAGTIELTRIRRVAGEPLALAKDLCESLQIAEAWVDSQTKNVFIRGNQTVCIKDWLEGVLSGQVRVGHVHSDACQH